MNKYDFEEIRKFLLEIYLKMLTEESSEATISLREFKNRFAPCATQRVSCFKSYVRKILKDIILLESLDVNVKVVGDKIIIRR